MHSFVIAYDLSNASSTRYKEVVSMLSGIGAEHRQKSVWVLNSADYDLDTVHFCMSLVMTDNDDLFVVPIISEWII